MSDAVIPTAEDLGAWAPANDAEARESARTVHVHRHRQATLAAVLALQPFERELIRAAYDAGQAALEGRVEKVLGRGETIRCDVVRAALRAGAGMRFDVTAAGDAMFGTDDRPSPALEGGDLTAWGEPHAAPIVAAAAATVDALERGDREGHR